MADFSVVWDRICRNAGAGFRTKTGQPFRYVVRNDDVRICRNDRGVRCSLSSATLTEAAALMPVGGPRAIDRNQAATYTWAILADPRIRVDAWRPRAPQASTSSGTSQQRA
jgi:hypothetical protein